MKKKLLNTLLVSVFVTTTLVGCNSGASGNVDNSAQNSPSVLTNATQSARLATPVIGSVNLPSTINMLGGDIIDAIIDPSSGVAEIGTQLLGLITGSIFPSKPSQSQLQQLEAQNAQIFSDIQSNLASIENTLAGQSQLLQTIYQTMLTNTINQNEITLNGLQNGLVNSISGFNSALVKNGATQLPTLLSANNNQTLTLSESDISALLTKDSVDSFISNFSQIQTDSLDTLEQTISADSAAQYSASNPALHVQQTQIQPSTTNNLLLNSLQNAFTSYSNQITANTKNGIFNGNLFESQMAWNNTVDSTILGMITTLNAAYRIDQVKLYLYYQTNRGINAPSVIYTPDLTNYESAIADLTYAYNQRLANLAAIDTNYKMMLWNQLFAVLGNNLSESSTCNLNNNYLSSLTSGAAMGSWNGVNLTISCQGGTVQSNGQNIQPVVNTNFTPSIPCLANSSGIYSDLTVTKAGYIICGTQPQDWNEGNINSIIQQQSSLPGIAPSQYSYSYIFEPLPIWVGEQMFVTLPGFTSSGNSNSTGLTFNNILNNPSGNFSNSGLWNWNYNPAAGPGGSLSTQVDGVGFISIANFEGNEFAQASVYYDNYHALAINATSPRGPTDGGSGVALACIPGLSDCTGVGNGGSFVGVPTNQGINFNTAKTSDGISFANGDRLQMTVTSPNQPTAANPVSNVTMQYVW